MWIVNPCTRVSSQMAHVVGALESGIADMQRSGEFGFQWGQQVMGTLLISTGSDSSRVWGQ